jgi:hypothetical protein
MAQWLLGCFADSSRVRPPLIPDDQKAKRRKRSSIADAGDPSDFRLGLPAARWHAIVLMLPNRDHHSDLERGFSQAGPAES